MSLEDLTAMVRVLDFVENLPSDKVTIGVVYETDQPEGKAAAVEVARSLNALQDVSTRRLQAAPVAVSDLANLPKVDALFLLPGLADTRSGALAETARRQHLVTLSNDPGCLARHDCTVFVEVGPQTQVTIDLAQSNASGIRFSMIFLMMVKKT